MVGAGGARRPALDVLLPPAQHAAHVVDEVRDGLQRPKARLPLGDLADTRTRSLWSELDDAERYYPLRCTRALAAAHGEAIAGQVKPRSLVVVGGADEQVVATLATAARPHGLGEVVAIGPVGPRLGATCAALETALPWATVRGAVADPLAQLAEVAFARPALLYVPGPTFGRLDGPGRARLLAAARRSMGPGDHLLVGLDLTTDRERALGAYDDPEGLHGERARNALAVLAREFAAEVDPDGWEPVVTWDERGHVVEVDLRARSPQRIAIASLDLERWFAADEAIELERNATFRPSGIGAQLALAGLDACGWWATAGDDYALVLAST
ncbi:MAG: L-histidine N(alpha)-methyltransferase [Acidimicrobiales bacterium]